MTKRTPLQAIRYCQRNSAQAVRTAVGMCKEQVEEAYNIPSAGNPDATTGWEATQHRFRNLWIPGALVHWTGGSHGHGHVAIMAFKYGYVWSKDILREGCWDRVPLPFIEHEWSLLRFAGASLDYEGTILRGMPSRKTLYQFPA